MEKSHMNKLSAELRNQIYELVVSFASPRRITAGFWGQYKAKQPAMTRTCKQIRNESLAMFYACNDFYLEEVAPTCSSNHDFERTFLRKFSELESWLACTRLHHEMIRSLRLEIDFSKQTQTGIDQRCGNAVNQLGQLLLQYGLRRPRLRITILAGADLYGDDWDVHELELSGHAFKPLVDALGDAVSFEEAAF